MKKLKHGEKNNTRVKREDRKERWKDEGSEAGGKGKVKVPFSKQEGEQGVNGVGKWSE